MSFRLSVVDSEESNYVGGGSRSYLWRHRSDVAFLPLSRAKRHARILSLRHDLHKHHFRESPHSIVGTRSLETIVAR